jgi:hypothetical protein
MATLINYESAAFSRLALNVLAQVLIQLLITVLQSAGLLDYVYFNH